MISNSSVYHQVQNTHTLDVYLHSSKILTIHQGLPRGVSSVGNPRGPLTGFNSGSVAEETLQGLPRDTYSIHHVQTVVDISAI